MSNYKNILCPVDFSDTSKRALDVAADFAEKFKAKLHLIHVFQLPSSSLPDGIYDAPDDLEAVLRGQVGKQLDEFIKENCKKGCDTTTGIYEGITYAEINRAAEENNADLIVIGTHGRTGVSHMLLGSVAERVVRTSNIPVLTVRK